MLLNLRRKIANKLYPEGAGYIEEIENIVFERAAQEKSDIDLVRECLKLLPLDIDYEPDLSIYEDATYLAKAVDVLENDAFNNEIKRIVHEQTKYIATQSPTELSSTLARGTINGVSLLSERLKGCQLVVEQQKENLKEEEEE